MKRKIAAIAMGMMIACAGLAGCGNKASESTAGTVESQSPVESQPVMQRMTQRFLRMPQRQRRQPLRKAFWKRQMK